MKIAALIVGLIGALLTAGLGAKWISDAGHADEAAAQIEKLTGSPGGGAIGADLVKSLKRFETAGWVMALLGVLALAAAVLVFKFNRPSGGVMIAAAIVPAIFAPQSLIVGFLLLVAGALALFAKPRRLA
jgi:hypothetical protein